ncbi:MAG: dihydrodipicolinate synthase family protein [Planctomycetes bacterium]|nr:dihydrodipicolinate synthase family protein [Planctomycetota bacterium]
MLTGILAAAVTPLRDGGNELDADAFPGLVDFYVKSGLDGLLALGTTGEGILLSIAERRRAAELFVACAGKHIQIAAHCGAQNTRDTVGLSRHAAEIGASAVAVIGPPYFAFDEESLLQHFVAAARACAPLPFYAYEFAARAGYALPVSMFMKLRDAAPNFAGIKVSNTPWEKFEPYIIIGLDVFVGPEALIARGLAAGAKGVVSGLAAAFPEIVAAHARRPTESESARVAALRAEMSNLPFHAAAKAVLASRGVRIREDVRAPLRGLGARDREILNTIIKRWQIS